MIRSRSLKLTGVLTSLFAVSVFAQACVLKNDASNVVCAPNQNTPCICDNDQKDDPSDTRRWVGLHKCGADGKSFATKCNGCHAEDAPAPASNGKSSHKTSGSGDTSNKPDPVEPTSSPDPPATKDPNGQHPPLQDAGLPPPSTTMGKDMDPYDVNAMPGHGVARGSCDSNGLSEGKGRCGTNQNSGHDFIEGCVSNVDYALDCAYWDMTNSPPLRATCEDPSTTASCVQRKVYQVDSGSLSLLSSYGQDMQHPCPSYWDGYGRCDDTGAIVVCSGGKDYKIPCAVAGLTCANTTTTVGCQ